MKLCGRNWVCIIGLAIIGCCPAGRALASDITACIDPEPPPSAYWVRDAQQHKTDVLTGSSIELVRTVFERLGLSVTFIGNLPWARCVKSVEAGTIDFAMDAYYDEDRAKLFLYSVYYQQLTPQVFFDAQRPINVQVKADLKKYRGCGLIGWSYRHYGLNPEDLDVGVNRMDLLFAKLKAGRCDYFVEELEAVAGYRILGIDYLGDPEIMHGPVTDAIGPKRFLITGKKSAAAKLIPKINQVLSKLIESGQAARIFAKYLNQPLTK